MTPVMDCIASTKEKMIPRNPELHKICRRVTAGLIIAIPMLFIVNTVYGIVQYEKETDFCVTERDYKFESVNTTCDEVRQTFKNHVIESLSPVLINCIILIVQIVMCNIKYIPGDMNHCQSICQSFYSLTLTCIQTFTIYLYWGIFDLQVHTEECTICCIIYELPCTKDTRGSCLPKIADTLNYWFCLIFAVLISLNVLCYCTAIIYLVGNLGGTSKANNKIETAALISPKN